MSIQTLSSARDAAVPDRIDEAIWGDLQSRLEDVIRRLCWYRVEVHEGVATFVGPDDPIGRLLLLNLARTVPGVRHIRFDPS